MAHLPANPKVGIAVAVFEPNFDYFRAQLKSIAEQSYARFVCVLCFDSSMKPVQEDSRFRPYLEDPRFIWLENEVRLGHLKNFEKAIRTVVEVPDVDSIAFCDQDDIWFSDKLEVSLGALRKAGPNGLVFCDMKLMDEAGNVSTQTAWKVERRGVENTGTFDLLVRNVIPGTGTLMDAELVRRFPVIPPGALFHDHWYPVVASVIGSVRPIHQALYAYRIHGENVAGVTPYTGLLARKEGASRGVLEKCQEVWKRSVELAQAAQGAGLELGWASRAAFLSRWDFGLALALRGIWALPRDPALARACWARAVGKALS